MALTSWKLCSKLTTTKVRFTQMLLAQDMIIHTTPQSGKEAHIQTFKPERLKAEPRSSTYNAVVTSSSFSPIVVSSSSEAVIIRSDSMYTSNGYNVGPSSAIYGSAGPGYGSYNNQASPETYLDDYVASPSPTDYVLESSSKSSGESKGDGKSHSQQRRPSKRDEFDGPHQFLQRPSPEYIAQQERDLPHLPTNLVVHEQDSILTRVNDLLSQCAFDFVAKYQFPIPLANGEMRPVERPQDREWTEWVYLLKRLATKRRIPARVLYNGQIKQFITILENSLEMRHAAKHQSRPLKDDRNILQLISAGIQVAKVFLSLSTAGVRFTNRCSQDIKRRTCDAKAGRIICCDREADPTAKWRPPLMGFPQLRFHEFCVAYKRWTYFQLVSVSTCVSFRIYLLPQLVLPIILVDCFLFLFSVLVDS